MTGQFFDEQEEQSRVKAEIVAAYFGGWANVLSKVSEDIGYLDLFSGPGRYGKSEMSTPLLILQHVLNSPSLRRCFWSTFNDANPQFTAALRQEARRLPGYQDLAHEPEFKTGEVDDSYIPLIQRYQRFPTLTFLDPWGYKGLSRALIVEAARGFGCEVIFFFNYNRINAAIDNELVEPHIEAFFPGGRLAQLRREIADAPPPRRERLVLVALGESIRELLNVWLIPFRFAQEGGRTSHYIVFATKGEPGYRIMKDVMASRGLVDVDDVPRFEYIPSYEGQQLDLLEERPLMRLGGELIEAFAGKTITVADLITQHHVGRPFIARNYKRVLLELEATAVIKCERPPRARKGKMGNSVRLTFKPR